MAGELEWDRSPRLGWPEARPEGGDHGIEGFHHGWEGGAAPKATPEQAKEVWRLWRENETLPKEKHRSPYRISELVFGERRFHMRVRRLLGIS